MGRPLLTKPGTVRSEGPSQLGERGLNGPARGGEEARTEGLTRELPETFEGTGPDGLSLDESPRDRLKALADDTEPTPPTWRTRMFGKPEAHPPSLSDLYAVAAPLVVGVDVLIQTGRMVGELFGAPASVPGPAEARQIGADLGSMNEYLRNTRNLDLSIFERDPQLKHYREQLEGFQQGVDEANRLAKGLTATNPASPDYGVNMQRLQFLTQWGGQRMRSLSEGYAQMKGLAEWRARHPFSEREPFPQQAEAALAVEAINLHYNILDGLRRKNGLGDPTSPVPILEGRVSDSGEGVTFVVKGVKEAQQFLDHIEAHVDDLGYRTISLKVRSRTPHELILETPSGRPISVKASMATPLRTSEPAVDWRDAFEDWGGMAVRSNRGLHYKDRNEDRHLMATFSDGRSVMVVIDGMGGHSGGDRAADVARQAMKEAVAAGNSPEGLLPIADAAVAGDNQAQGLKGKKGAPGAVAMVVEITPRADGRYDARFDGIGDCEAVVLRPGSSQPVIHHTMRPNQLSQLTSQFKLLDDGRLERGQTIDFRTDPYANKVDGALGHGDKIETSLPKEPLRRGDIVIMGSDGLFENFGSLSLVHQVVRQSGAKTAGEIRDALMTEALIRMSLRDNAFNKVLSHQDYVAAYREAAGHEPPANWRGFYEPYRDASGQARGHRMDNKGNIYEVVYDAVSGTAKDVTGKKIDHFKNDNVTVAVQIIGDPVH